MVRVPPRFGVCAKAGLEVRWETVAAARAPPPALRRSRRLSPATLPIQPGRQETPTVVVADVGGVVLQRALPDGDLHGRRHLDVVLLLGEVALDLVDDLAPLGDVLSAALANQHVGHDGVIDVALVLELA